MTIPQTEIEKKRTDWLAEYYKPGMSFSEMVKLNDEVIVLYPQTAEERAQTAKDWEDMSNFAL